MERLEDLDRHITKEDICSIVKELPLEKSLGPDVFNTYYEKCRGK
jgi:hypothetical protein